MQGFGQLPQTTPKLYWKNPKPFRLLGKNQTSQGSPTCSMQARINFWHRRQGRATIDQHGRPYAAEDLKVSRRRTLRQEAISSELCRVRFCLTASRDSTMGGHPLRYRSAIAPNFACLFQRQSLISMSQLKLEVQGNQCFIVSIPLPHMLSLPSQCSVLSRSVHSSHPFDLHGLFGGLTSTALHFANAG